MKNYQKKLQEKRLNYLVVTISYLDANLGLNHATVTGAKRALKEYQTFTRFADFDSFSVNQVKDFKDHILKIIYGDISKKYTEYDIFIQFVY